MATKSKESKTIFLPFEEEKYPDFVKNKETTHQKIGDLIKKHPELFPEDLAEKGYSLYGKDRISKKMGIQLRRIKIGTVIYRIRPSFVLPYMRAKTKDAENALLLIRFGVPFWVIAIVFGRNPMYWYRLYICLAFNNLVGTTVYNMCNER